MYVALSRRNYARICDITREQLPIDFVHRFEWLSKGVFPDAMKIAKVTSVYKKGEKDILGNYRPISVLPLLAKVLEKIINGFRRIIVQNYHLQV